MLPSHPAPSLPRQSGINTARLALACALLAGCRSRPVDEGTSVGNPGNARLTVAPGADLVFRTADVPVADLTWRGCSGAADVVVPIDAALDLLTSPSLEAPEGRWCGVDLAAAGPLVMSVGDAAGTGDAALTLDLQLVEVPSAKAFSVTAATDMVLEIAAPGWLSKSGLGIADGTTVTIDSGHPLHDSLTTAAEASSGLYEDDGDGTLSNSERSSGAVAAGSDRPEDDDDDDDDDDE